MDSIIVRFEGIETEDYGGGTWEGRGLVASAGLCLGSP